MTATWEREIKLSFQTAEAARTAVRALGGPLLRPRRIQRDTLFDTAEGSLSLRRSVLRVRRDGDDHFITFKNPVDHPTIKLREEIETRVASADVASAIFEQLGMRPWFRYEKYREEFRVRGAIVAVDETPVGVFVEIEGSDEDIEEIARSLGRGPGDYVTDSYRALFLRYCAERGLEPGHMVFSPTADLV